MNTSIPQSESPPTISSVTQPRALSPVRPRVCEPTLERVPNEDPSAPPLFELRAEYMVDADDAPSRLCGAVGKFTAAAVNLVLSAIYFLGLGAFAPLVRSRDPLGLTAKGSGRWLPLSPVQERSRSDSRG